MAGVWRYFCDAVGGGCDGHCYQGRFPMDLFRTDFYPTLRICQAGGDYAGG